MPEQRDYVRLDAWIVQETGERVYKLTVQDAGLVKAHLDQFDRLLIAECDSADATISDKLLGLETLVRRIEQASHTAQENAS